jgi:hypothetical protein
MKRFLIAGVFLVACQIANAQVGVPILKVSADDPIYGIGPSVSPLRLKLSYDLTNENAALDSTIDDLSVEYLLENQVYSSLPYGISTHGVMFGASPSLPSSTPVSLIQEGDPAALFAPLGSYINDTAGPTEQMFTAYPYASGTGIGTGFYPTVDKPSLIGFIATGAASIFTASQPLYASNTPGNARVYYGDLIIRFSRPVKDPVVHFAGLGGSYSYVPFGQSPIAANYRRTFFTTELELVDTTMTSTLLSSNQFLTLQGNNVLNNDSTPNGNSVPVFESPDNNGAATGSIRLNGVLQEARYRLYLRGSNGNIGINWSAEGIDSLGQLVVSGATRDPFPGDMWYSTVSLLAPTRQITGNVFRDKDGLSDNDITKSGGVQNPKTNAGKNLYANLVTPSGTVVASQKISTDGVFLFDSVALGNYQVQITSLPGTVGASMPATTLPTNWVNTGEYIGPGVGSDGTVDGMSVLLTPPASGVLTNVNFGIELVPNSTDRLQVIAPPALYFIPAGTATTAVVGADPEEGVLGNPNTITITNLPTNSTLSYNGVPVVQGDTIVGFDPTKLSYASITPGSTSVVFNYAFIDLANKVDPTPASYTLSWSLPLSTMYIGVNGTVRAEDNLVTIRLEGNLSKVQTVELYRSVGSSSKSELVYTTPLTASNYDYVDLKVENNKSYTYYAVGRNAGGIVKQSNTVVLNRLSDYDVVVFPNPAQTEIKLMFEQVLAENADANIFNAEGKLVGQSTIEAGTKEHTYSVSHLANGSYLIQITHDNKIKLVKFVKN